MYKTGVYLRHSHYQAVSASASGFHRAAVQACTRLLEVDAEAAAVAAEPAQAIDYVQAQLECVQMQLRPKL